MGGTRWGHRGQVAVAAVLMASLAACSTSVATGTPPATSIATASLTPEPSPTDTPVPTPALEPPASPAEITWSVPCNDDFTCTGYGEDPFVVTWTPVGGVVSGYVLYYTPGEFDPCAPSWTPSGDPIKIASVEATATNWTGTIPSMNGKFSVVAHNGGGMSAPTMSEAAYYMDVSCP